MTSTQSKKLKNNFCIWSSCLLVLLINVFFLPQSAFSEDEKVLLQNLSVTMDNDTVGANTSYTVSFMPGSTLNQEGAIVIKFPPGFHVANSVVVDGLDDLDGGLSAVGQDSVVTIFRSGKNESNTLFDTNQVGVRFAIVQNTQLAGDRYTLKVHTLAKGHISIEDTITPSSSFEIKAATIDHFAVEIESSSPPVVSLQAGQIFSLKITAQDRFGNPTPYTGTVNITDDTGTIAPSTPSTFAFNGETEMTKSMIITLSESDVVITALSNGHTGQSLPFKVTLDVLDNIKIMTGSNGLTQELGNTTIIAGDSLLMHTSGFDAFDNYIDDQAADWTQDGTDLNPFNDSIGQVTFTIKPEIAATGQVRATVSSRSDLTGNITVTPAEPSGNIILSAARGTLPFTAGNRTNVSSATIKDRFGNDIGEERLFNVSVVDTSLGGVDFLNGNGSQPSLQVFSDAISQINFDFVTKGNSGTAQISIASADNGTATGSVAISVNELRIISVQSDLDTVSAGQDSIAVTMVVENIGTSSISFSKSSFNTNILFNGGSEDFTTALISPTDNNNTLPGNSETILLFDVTAENSAEGSIGLGGVITGMVEAIGDVSDSFAVATDTFVVQTPANLAPSPNSLSPTSLSVTVPYELSIGIENSGQASIILDPLKTIIKFGTPTCEAVLDDLQQTRIDSGTNTLIFRLKEIPLNFPADQYAPQVTITGTQNGAFFMETLQISDSITVRNEAPFEILSVAPTVLADSTVTQNMTREWDITLEVRNNSSSPMVMDEQAGMEVWLNGVKDDYNISLPGNFVEGDTLEPNSSGTIVFEINRTGSKTGMAGVFATIRVRETGNGRIHTVSTNRSEDVFLVQTRAQLDLEFQTSQPFVTQGQEQPWSVTMTVTNKGESDVSIDSSRTKLFLADSAGYVLQPPASFHHALVPGGGTYDIQFVIGTTGSEPGKDLIDGAFGATEINSETNALLGTIVTTSITVQDPAKIFIDSTYIAGTSNGDSVNIGQDFQVHVRVKKSGQERVERVKIKLKSDDVSNISDDIFTIAGFDTLATAETISAIAVFNVTASGSINPKEIFTASIDSSLSFNTKDLVKTEQASDNIAEVFITQEAELEVVSVTTSISKIPPLSSEKWSVYVALRDRSNASDIWLDMPSESDLKMIIGMDEQGGYEMISPVKLLNSDSLRLSGNGQTDTLEYIITQTGNTSGALKIQAAISGKDINSESVFTRFNMTEDSVRILTEAGIRIVKTHMGGSVHTINEIGFVNTGQEFSVEVDLMNIGPETIDTVYVSLEVIEGNSTITSSRDTVTNVSAPTGIGSATFKVQIPDLSEGIHKFKAGIVSAFTKTGIEVQNIPDAIDSTALAQVQKPAELQLSAEVSPTPLLTADQEFFIHAAVTNIGEAEFYNNGTDFSTLEIAGIPTGYNLVSDTTQRFDASGDIVRWELTAPSDGQARVDTFIVQFAQLPLDRNSNDVVLRFNTDDSLFVTVDSSSLKIERVEITNPSGAMNDTVSTEQVFEISAVVAASKNLTNVKAELTLADDYNFFNGDSATKQPMANAVKWSIKAPDNEHADLRNFRVVLTGSNAADVLARPDTAFLPVIAESKAEFELKVAITAPDGAKNNTLSIDQQFTITARLINSGNARVSDTGKIELIVGDTNIILDQPNEQSIVIDNTKRFGEVTWNATAPNSVTISQSLIFQVNQFPIDNNTNERAASGSRNATLDIKTVDRGSLEITSFQISFPDGAKDNTVSTGQEFVLEADLIGENAINVEAELSLPDGFSSLGSLTPGVPKSYREHRTVGDSGAV